MAEEKWESGRTREKEKERERGDRVTDGLIGH